MGGDPMRVTALDLEGAGLEGSISAALGRLSAVTRLHLRTNPGLTGEIRGRSGQPETMLTVPEPAQQRSLSGARYRT